MTARQFHEAEDIDGVLIDKRLAPTIKALWAAGFRTKYCCEGGISPYDGVYHNGYIMFDDEQDGVPDFFKLVTKTFPKTTSVDMTLERSELGSNSAWVIRFDPKNRGAIQRCAEYLPKKAEAAA